MDESVETLMAAVPPKEANPYKDITLPQHELNSEARAARIEHSIYKLKEHTMSISERGQDVNIFQRDGLGGGMGRGDGFGGGLGTGLVGGILGGLLFNRRGGFGGDGGDGVTPILDNAANLAILAKLGTVEAAVPLTALQTQATISGEIGSLALGGQQGFANVKDAIQASAALQLTIAAGIKDAVQANSLANLAATNAQGDRIVALINSNEVANLQRQLVVADLDRRDERSFGRSREVEVNVTQTVNQAQAQAQAQLQAQQQGVLLAQIAAVLPGFANQLNNVHQGIVQIGAGNAAIPTTTNTNVR